MTTASPTSTPNNDGNLLGRESSPYLLQHKDNPVHWRAWGDAAFREAREENKPILLSVGYAACHWCHVMAHESFEEPAVAELMNRLFVNIKVDREERPDVDQLYQNALALLGEHGGWPLTMFLTPEGHPFWGGTYFPPEPRYGRPGFPQVLQRIAEIYDKEGDKVRKNVDALNEALGKLAANSRGEGIPPEKVEQTAQQFLGMIDPANGGLMGAPKFPQPPVFDLLWRVYRRTGGELFKRAVTMTLDKMSQGGIYDHLGGGFARYSTDDHWLAPHFEKMLYDNAQLVALLTEVWRETRSPLYESRVRETVDWLEREMRVTHDGQPGAWAGTLDADSEGEEGKFYVWTEEEVDAVLGEDAALFKEHYDVRPEGNWEGKTILNRSRNPALADDATEAKLAECRAKLFEARAGRVRPELDDKVLADWNGLMIAALADAGAAFDEPGWIAAAQEAFDFVLSEMTVDGALRHSWRQGRASHPATLDDHASLARAAVALYEVTGNDDYLRRAEAWLETVEAHFADPANGGYFLSADEVTDVPMRSKVVFDNATPSGNGMLVHVYTRLFNLTGDDAYRQRAEAVVNAFSGELGRNALGMPVLLAGSLLLHDALQVVIAGEPGAEDTQALRRTALESPAPNRIFQQLGPKDALPESHPAAGKGMTNGRAAAYVCRGPTCSLPITEPDALREALARPAAGSAA